MKLKFNKYKINKLKNLISTMQLSVFYQINSLNLKNWLKVEQVLIYETLHYQQLCNILAKNTIQKSIFKNFIELIKGSLFCISIQNKEKKILSFKKFLNLDFALTLLCIRINNRLYSIFQLKSILNLSYIFNILELYKVLNDLLIIVSKKLYYFFSK